MSIKKWIKLLKSWNTFLNLVAGCLFYLVNTLFNLVTMWQVDISSFKSNCTWYDDIPCITPPPHHPFYISHITVNMKKMWEINSSKFAVTIGVLAKISRTKGSDQLHRCMSLISVGINSALDTLDFSTVVLALVLFMYK